MILSSFHQHLGILLMFALDMPVTRAMEEFDVSSTTAVDYYSMAREVCSIRILNDLHEEKLGGPGKSVEIDEMKVRVQTYYV
jgi:hypothetical protein